MNITTSNFGNLAPQNLNKQRSLLSLLAFLLIVASVGLILKFGFLGLGALFAILATCVVVIMAYRYPFLTIVITLLTSQIVNHELRSLLPEALFNLQVGPILLRLFDPILLGVLATTFIKLLLKDSRLKEFLFVTNRAWAYWIGWVFLIVLISIGIHGFNTLGEFRTYYQYLLLIPYILVSFKTRDEQIKLFKLLVVISLLLIPVAFIRQGALYGFSIAAYNKFLTSSGNLTLINGLIALMIAYKHKAINLSKFRYQALIVLVLGITLLNSVRSVWLALAVAMLWLYASGRFSITQQFQLVLVFTLVLLVGNIAVSNLGGLDFGAFIENRLKAFTEFQEDSSSSWRFHLWQQALLKIYEKPIWGNGLGHHFKLKALSGQIITTSPHNLYITLAYQTGVIGLALYLYFWIQLIFQLRKMGNANIDKYSRTIILTGLVLLFASAGYYMAYIFDVSTWLFVGLAIAVMIRLRKEKYAEELNAKQTPMLINNSA